MVLRPLRASAIVALAVVGAAVLLFPDSAPRRRLAGLSGEPEPRIVDAECVRAQPGAGRPLRGALEAGPLSVLNAGVLARASTWTFRPIEAHLRATLREPVAASVRRATRRALRRPPDGTAGLSALQLPIDPGAEVTLVIPEPARSSLTTIFTARARQARIAGIPGLVRYADGDHTVRFPTCHPGGSWFEGGVIAAAPGCYPLEIRLRDAPPRRVWLGVATGRRRCGLEIVEEVRVHERTVDQVLGHFDPAALISRSY